MITTLFDSVQDTLRKESEAILEVKNNIVKAQLEKVYRAITTCKGKIITTGCGTSGVLAQKVAHTLCCVDCPAVFLSPSQASHGGLGLVQKDDIMIAFSKGGESMEVNNMIPSIKKIGSTLIAVTESKDSYLASESNIFLKIKIQNEADDFNMLATSSTSVTMAVFDSISIAIARLRGYTKEQFLIIHPGGEVGKRLSDLNYNGR